MTKNDIIAAASAHGYSGELIRFLGAVPYTHNAALTLEAIRADLPEREVLICALQNDTGESEHSRADAEERYRSMCDKAGAFRFADFLSPPRSYVANAATPGLFG